MHHPKPSTPARGSWLPPLPLMTALILGLAACQGQAKAPAKAPAAGSSPAQASADQGTQGPLLSGTVLETLDASRYTYARLRLDGGGELWVAGPKTPIRKGQTLRLRSGPTFKDFKSPTLHRTFPELRMVESFGAPAQGQASPHGGPHGAPHGGDPVLDQAMQAAHQGVHGVAPGVAVPKAGALARAQGPSGHTVAELHAQAKALAGQTVTVRGVVVKVTREVLGKDWFHLRDGTGQGPTADLTVTTSPKNEQLGLGLRVLVTGKLAADKDLGAGYRYDVLLEDATIHVEAMPDQAAKPPAKAQRPKEARPGEAKAKAAATPAASEPPAKD